MDPQASNLSHLPNYPLARHPLDSILLEVLLNPRTLDLDKFLLVRYHKVYRVALQLVELLNSLQWVKSPKFPHHRHQGKCQLPFLQATGCLLKVKPQIPRIDSISLQLQCSKDLQVLNLVNRLWDNSLVSKGLARCFHIHNLVSHPSLV